MPKRSPRTPRSRIRSVLRGQLWLRSRERAATLKRDNYTCVECGRKQSKAKGREQAVEVHHRDGIDWEYIIDYIQKHLLCDPERLETRCPDCHGKLNGGPH